MLSFVRTAVVVFSAVSAFAIGATGASSPANAHPGWVAIAADGKGSWGYALGEPNEDQARAFAMAGCAPTGIGCQIVGVAQAPCFAYVDTDSRGGEYKWAGYYGPTEEQAINEALNRCLESGGLPGTCQVVKSGCE
jgi:Domain of unknown function (DUF4189)